MQGSYAIDLLATASQKDTNLPYFTKSYQELCIQNYGDLLESGKFSDVVFVVGGRDFHVHKVILAAHSPVFAAMFEHEDTKEAKENKVTITDIDADVIEELLGCIYSSKVVIKDYCAVELFVAADKVCFRKIP